MYCVATAVSVFMFLADCARDEPPVRSVAAAAAGPLIRTTTRMVTKEVRLEVPMCPTDDHIRDTAIEASKVTCRSSTTAGTKACACPEDHYERLGVSMPCSGLSAIKPATWVMCSREQVPAALVVLMRAKFPACSKQS
jgi:hypothetical protein